MKVLLHVNYLEGAGDRLEQLFQLARENGCDGVELRWKYRFNDRTQGEYQQRIAQLKGEYPDFEIVFGGQINFCRGSREEVETETAAYLEFLDWAKAHCGTRVMNFFTGGLVRPDQPWYLFDQNGSALAEEGDYERSAAGLRRIGDRAEKLGIRIALESHNNYLHDLAAPCAKLMELTGHPAIGVNYDQGNIQLNDKGETIGRYFELLPDKTYYAHLKNVHRIKGVNGGGYVVTRLEEGEIDQYLVMEHLKKHLRGDLIAIEYPCPGDGRIAARRDMNYIRELKEMLEIE